MSFWLQVWLSVCGGLFVLAVSLRWVVGPMRVHARQFAAARLSLNPVADAQLSPEMRDFFGRFYIDAARSGFAGSGQWSLGKTAESGVTTMRSAPTGDTVHAAAVRLATSRSNVVSVRSKFWDGSVVVTSNTSLISGHRPNPRYDYAGFSWARDLTTLVEAHVRRLNRLGKADTRRIDAPLPGDESAHILRNWIETLDWQVTSGYLFLDAAGQRYRPTWKGAAMISWKLTQPLKRWLLASRERKMQKLWRSLGMDSFTLPPQLALLMDEGESAGNEPTGSPSETKSLRYEPGLQEGELRQEQSHRNLIVRMGGPTSTTVLKRLLPKIIFAAICAIAVVAALADNWLAWHRMANLSFAVRWHRMPRGGLSLLGFSIVWLLSFAMDAVRLIVRDVRQVRGTVALSASHAGIIFSNAPGTRSDGELHRDEIEGLFVRVHRLGFAGRRYRLDARLFTGGARVMLLVGKDRAVLDQARLALFEAMGMALPNPENNS